MIDRTLFPGLSRAHWRAANSAWSKGEEALRHFEAKATDPDGLSLLSQNSQRFLRKIRSNPWPDNSLPLSSTDVRTASGQAMIESIVSHASDDDRLWRGKTRLKLLTIKPDVGLVNIEGHSYPAELTKRTSRSYISKSDIDAVMMLDLALFTPGRGQPEFLAHIHCHGAAALLAPPAKQPTSVRSQVSPKRKSINRLGDNVVNLSHRGTGNPATLTGDEIAGLGWYISKLTCGASTIYQGKGGQKSEKSHTDWTFAGALRQLEFWSYVDVFDSCWAHGEVGRSIRKHWRQSLIERLELGQLPRERVIDTEKLQCQWKRVWAELDNGFSAIEPASITATTRKQLWSD